MGFLGRLRSATLDAGRLSHVPLGLAAGPPRADNPGNELSELLLDVSATPPVYRGAWANRDLSAGDSKMSTALSAAVGR